MSISLKDVYSIFDNWIKKNPPGSLIENSSNYQILIKKEGTNDVDFKLNFLKPKNNPVLLVGFEYYNFDPISFSYKTADKMAQSYHLFANLNFLIEEETYDLKLVVGQQENKQHKVDLNPDLKFAHLDTRNLVLPHISSWNNVPSVSIEDLNKFLTHAK